ncbi:MAG: zinc ABC transporter substrate-binding protein [Candidatus Izemoplasmatales bacterium]|nr:zinc ABC transporter substrate-binding protein [Candidatus Izemoplasmatales bacterium]
MKKLFLLLITTLIMSLVISCVNNPTTSDKIKVAVSIVPESAFVEAIAGDLVEVVTVIPPGYSPGNYEPSSQFMEDLSNASVYFAIGVAAEDATIIPFLEDDILIIHLDEIVALTYQERMFSGESRDPHIWLSIKRVIVMINAIANTLVSLDSGNEAIYLANASAYIASLQSVDSLLVSAFSSITMNKFIVFHPAYGYFADDYGLDMIAVEEDGQEATASHLTDVIDIANANDIHTIFYQAEIDSSQVEAFAEEINAVMVELDPLAYDYLTNIITLSNLILEALR